MCGIDFFYFGLVSVWFLKQTWIQVGLAKIANKEILYKARYFFSNCYKC